MSRMRHASVSREKQARKASEREADLSRMRHASVSREKHGSSSSDDLQLPLNFMAKPLHPFKASSAMGKQAIG